MVHMFTRYGIERYREVTSRQSRGAIKITIRTRGLTYEIAEMGKGQILSAGLTGWVILRLHLARALPGWVLFVKRLSELQKEIHGRFRAAL
jgi:hypothetical protein